MTAVQRSEAEKKTRVLIVDDDDDLRETLIFDFEKKNYDVLSAEDGKRAFEILQKESVHLVISDIRMPQWDGVRLLQEIQEKLPTPPPLIFVTAHSDVSIEEAYAMGAEGIFRKPFDRDEFFEAVNRTLSPIDKKWKRKHPRFRTNCIIEMELSDVNQARDGRLMNVGKGGCFIAMEKGIPPTHSTLTFSLKIPLSKKTIEITGTGVVRWRRPELTQGFPAGFGFEFTEIDDDSIEDLMNFIQTLENGSFIPRS